MKRNHRLTPWVIQDCIFYLIEHQIDPVDFVRNVEHDLGWECMDCGQEILKPKSTNCPSCQGTNTVMPLWLCSSCGWTKTLVIDGRCRACDGLIKEYWRPKPNADQPAGVPDLAPQTSSTLPHQLASRSHPNRSSPFGPPDP